jgi:hypothetical protein
MERIAHFLGAHELLYVSTSEVNRMHEMVFRKEDLLFLHPLLSPRVEVSREEFCSRYLCSLLCYEKWSKLKR